MTSPDHRIAALHRQTDVCLVLMPYASLERPSIALSILKAALTAQGVDSRVIYGNMLFAEKIGAHIYDIVNKSQSHGLAGEWTFSQTLFPDFAGDPTGYFAHTRQGLDALQPFVTYLGSPMDIRDVLTKIRTVTTPFIDELARSLLAMQPKIIGCSSTFQQHCASLALLKRIKELSPDTVTIIGGANCEATMGIVTHQECPWVDYVVSGEADVIFPWLVDSLLAGHQPVLEELPAGIIGPPHRSPQQYAMLELRPPRAKLANMAESPAPDYDDYFEFIEQVSCGRYIKPGLLVETSRGCWWGAISHCTFCGLNGESMGHRSKDQERAAREILDLSQRYGMTSIEVVDNILDMSYFQHFIPTLTEAEVELDLFYETKSNLSKAKLTALSDAGIRWLQPGIESLDDTILEMIGKGTTARTNLQMMKWAQEKGIFVLWILLYDLPGEDDDLYATMAEWLPMIYHLQPPSGFSFIQINRFSPYHMRPEDYGLTLSTDRSYSYVYPWSQESIDRFAYYFDDYTKNRQHLDFLGHSTSDRPGLNAIQQSMDEWRLAWHQRSPEQDNPEKITAHLIFTEHEAELLLYDTRPCALAPRYQFTGLRRYIYLLCDAFTTPAGIQRGLTEQYSITCSLEEITKELSALCATKTMLQLKGYYFSLAVRHPYYRQLPKRKNYPGGRLYSKIEVENLELLRHAKESLL